MPNKTIYVKHEDLPLLGLLSGNVSSLFAEFLHLKAMAQSNVIDPAGHCPHVDVKRSMIELGVTYGDTWYCTDCGAEFYHLQNLSSGKLTIMEPYATLRDQFAMAALTGLLAVPGITNNPTVVTAYQIADEAMEVRNNQDGGKGFDAAVDRVIARVDKHL